MGCCSPFLYDLLRNQRKPDCGLVDKFIFPGRTLLKVHGLLSEFQCPKPKEDGRCMGLFLL